MDKIERITQVLGDIRELRQHLVTHDMDLLGLEILIVETGEVVPVKYNNRSFSTDEEFDNFVAEKKV